MLELLWVESLEDARNEAVRPLLLADRWLGRSLNASPFGICLRPSDTQTRLPPFQSYEYRPSYFPAGLAAHIGLGTSLAEPLWFFMDYKPAFPVAARRSPRHRVGVRRITGVTVMLPQPPSLVTTAAAGASGVEMRIGPEHHLWITFDGGQNRCTHQFSPTLPMEFQW